MLDSVDSSVRSSDDFVEDREGRLALKEEEEKSVGRRRGDILICMWKREWREGGSGWRGG